MEERDKARHNVKTVNVSLVGVGASEYLVQRFTGMFMLYRSIQTLSAALMVFVVFRCYALCCDEPEY